MFHKIYYIILHMAFIHYHAIDRELMSCSIKIDLKIREYVEIYHQQRRYIALQNPYILLISHPP